MTVLSPEEVEEILKPYDEYIPEKDRYRWEYYSEEDLVDGEIDLKFIGKMSDPVALWRPQDLRSFYGSVKGTKVIIVLGTDEGLSIPAGLLTGVDAKDIKRQIKSDEWAEMWELIEGILPMELINDSPKEGK